MKKRIFCAHCRNQYEVRNSNNKKMFFMLTVLGIILASYFYGIFGVKIFLSIFPLMVIIEYAKRISNRISLSCPNCGFDYLLYKKDVKKARDRILEFKDKKDKKFKDLLALGVK